MRGKRSSESGWVFLSLAMMFSVIMALLSALPAHAGVLEDVRNQFNRDKGTPRLVLLVSPT